MTAVTEKRTELHSEAIILCQTWGITRKKLHNIRMLNWKENIHFYF